MEQATLPPELPTQRRAVTSIITFHGLSSFCWGLVFPFTGIYLAGQEGVGTGGVGLYYATSGVANLLASLLLAAGIIRLPRVSLGVAGNLLSLSGYLLMPAASSLSVVSGAAFAIGAGQGFFMAAAIPIVNSLVSESDRRRVFAVRYQVLNGTLAAGSLVAGLTTSVLSRDVIPYLFLINAIGYVPIALTLLATRKASTAGETAAAARNHTGKHLPLTTLVKVSLTAALFQFGAYLLGYSQFEATMPLTADTLIHTGLGWISIVIAVNIGIIVIAQQPITRLLERWPEATGLRIATVLWVGGFLAAGLLAFGSDRMALIGLLIYALLFGLGECAYSSSFHPWLISKVPESELTRANALSNSMMGVGMFAGPSIGVALISFGSAPFVWLPLALLCGLIYLTTLQRRR